MTILAENSEFNLTEDDNSWIILWKENNEELRRYSKKANPMYPIAAVAKWGYTPVDTVRMNEIMKTAQ